MRWEVETGEQELARLVYLVANSKETLSGPGRRENWILRVVLGVHTCALACVNLHSQEYAIYVHTYIICVSIHTDLKNSKFNSYML